MPRIPLDMVDHILGDCARQLMLLPFDITRKDWRTVRLVAERLSTTLATLAAAAGEREVDAD